MGGMGGVAGRGARISVLSSVLLLLIAVANCCAWETTATAGGSGGSGGVPGGVPGGVTAEGLEERRLSWMKAALMAVEPSERTANRQQIDGK